VSKLSGGNFANGARTAAIQHLFNYEGGAQKRAHSTLAKLRGIPEFAALEEKYGKLTLTFDNSKATSLDGNTLNINESIFSREYRVDIDASVNAFQDTLSADLSDTAYWGAIDSYEASLPKFYGFSMERVLVHEAFHLMQGDVSGLKYTLNRDHLESVTIGRTNAFMSKHFNEPYRVRRHGDVR